MHDPSDDAGPSCLVAGAQSGSVVSVEVLVKQDVVAPVRICLELLRTTVYWPSASLISQENLREPAADLLSYLVQRHVAPRTGRALDPKFVAVVHVVLQQSPNDQA